ncbi:unnamed protein product, partial [Cyprideis torosa]
PSTSAAPPAPPVEEAATASSAGKDDSVSLTPSPPLPQERKGRKRISGGEEEDDEEDDDGSESSYVHSSSEGDMGGDLTPCNVSPSFAGGSPLSPADRLQAQWRSFLPMLLSGKGNLQRWATACHYLTLTLKEYLGGLVQLARSSAQCVEGHSSCPRLLALADTLERPSLGGAGAIGLVWADEWAQCVPGRLNSLQDLLLEAQEHLDTFLDKRERFLQVRN